MDATSKASIANSQLASPMDAQTAIRKAARETGADFGYLLKTAKRESGLDASAKATTSSATGLFQFTDDTWLRMVDRYGEKHGLTHAADAVAVSGGKARVADASEKADILAMREDPMMASIMAGELANENATILKRGIGREPTSQELYVAHFMGPKGAVDLIKATENGSSQKAADLFPAAARANPAIFNERNGQARSVAAVYSNLTGQHVPEPNTTSEVFSEIRNVQQSIVRSAPLPPVSTLKIGAELSTGMVMTLLDLQQKHFEIAEKDKNDEERVTKTIVT
ncbi:lysozyme family protein [Hirschia baltica]|uniref:Lytic transglycosylase catalytic n=1 Tax=Hirschia baltica (strain ATCC 49814 / DSM 5838 / IFAM 1418) TaxID=582402 RepID=C6XLX7_HIRBI|nr:hypothetical protein [Hirschia baltica]ACT59809.1 hypothetical protein Hbal_2128 [Hirschia baltica ATCC 49814]